MNYSVCSHPECIECVPLDDFERAYLECALWSSTDNSRDDGGDPLDENYEIEDIEKASLTALRRECESFREQAKELLEQAGLSDEQAGHDFWLTRNGHGAGFWDRGLGKAGDELSALCEPYGSVNLYVGDDGKVYAQ